MMCFNIKSYKHLQNNRTAFYALFMALFVNLLSISPVLADSYTVEDIKVDVKAANAVEAREKAFEEAQIKGYKMLATRFLSAEELENFTTPDINTVSPLVKDFELTNEKLSTTRYAGTYKIRYSSKAFANKSAVGVVNPSANSQSNTVRPQRGDILVLPFFEDAGAVSLWRPNPFMQAWLKARDSDRAAPAIVPVGDMNDISAIKDNDALRYNPAGVEGLKKRYRARGAAILVANPELLPDGSQNINVSIYNATAQGPQLVRQISVLGSPVDAREQVYANVIAEVNKVLGAGWMRDESPLSQNQIAANLPPLTGPVQTLVAQINYSTMRQWVDAKKSIERSYGVKVINVKSLSPRAATMIVSYQGSVENLRQSLGLNGIKMNDPLTQYGQADASKSGVYQMTPMGR